MLHLRYLGLERAFVLRQKVMPNYLKVWATFLLLCLSKKSFMKTEVNTAAYRCLISKHLYFDLFHFSYYTHILLIFLTIMINWWHLSLISSSLGALSNNVQKEAHNMGVSFNSELSFDALVTKEVHSCFAQLRHLTKIRLFLYSADLEKGILDLISSRLDFCSALNSDWASCLTRMMRTNHITTILAALH